MFQLQNKINNNKYFYYNVRDKEEVIYTVHKHFRKYSNFNIYDYLQNTDLITKEVYDIFNINLNIINNYEIIFCCIYVLICSKLNNIIFYNDILKFGLHNFEILHLT
jgi:hypothetical protein